MSMSLHRQFSFCPATQPIHYNSLTWAIDQLLPSLRLLVSDISVEVDNGYSLR